MVKPAASRAVRVWCHRTGLVNWAFSKSGQSVPPAVVDGVYVGRSQLPRDRGILCSRRLWRDVLEQMPCSACGRLPPTGRGDDLFGAEFFGDGGGGCDGVGISSYDDLSRGVVVGDPHIRCGAIASDQNGVIVRGRRLRPWVPSRSSAAACIALPRSVTSVTASPNSSTPADVRGRILAQAMASMAGCFDAKTRHSVEHHHRHHECGELAVAGLGEFVCPSCQQQTGYISVGGLRCLFHQFPMMDDRPTRVPCRVSANPGLGT